MNSFNDKTIYNYEIIKNEENYFHNDNNKKEIHEKKEKKETIIENIRLSLKGADKNSNSNSNENKENELDQQQERRTRKSNQAFDRFKRKYRYLSQEKDIQKSNKISNMAQVLESNMGQIKNLTMMKNNSINPGEICEFENSKIDYNNRIVDLINKQPVINKKKKSIRSFSMEAQTLF